MPCTHTTVDRLRPLKPLRQVLCMFADRTELWFGASLGSHRRLEVSHNMRAAHFATGCLRA